MQRNGNNGTSACASCKHQRKKCTDKCTLAPFFPVEKSREFKAVHKVFGVSNITKIITNLKEEDRKVAVDSLVWEALCRYKDPVLGPYADYRRVCEELRLYKAQSSHQFQQQLLPPQDLMGNWSNNAKVINNISHKFQSNNASFSTYGFTERVARAESGNAASALIMMPNHYLHNYTAQCNPMHTKPMESTLWEGSS